MNDRNSLWQWAERGDRSNEGLDVVHADGVIGEGVSVVLATESLEERAEVLVEEAAEAHPEVVEVPSDNPGGGEEAWWFNELYKLT